MIPRGGAAPGGFRDGAVPTARFLARLLRDARREAARRAIWLLGARGLLGQTTARSSGAA